MLLGNRECKQKAQIIYVNSKYKLCMYCVFTKLQILCSNNRAFWNEIV
jgi:hypothetical protein